MKASWKKYTLVFKQPSGTSRGVLKIKESWFILLEYENGDTAIGECGLLKGLSYDDVPNYEDQLDHICLAINRGENVQSLNLLNWPSIRFGLEMALASDNFLLFNNEFIRGETDIPINGLIWMGDADFMLKEIDSKIDQGFTCLKMKIGNIDFDSEIEILTSIRNRYGAETMTIRVDANGAFSNESALEKLAALAKLKIHSIEQPIAAGQWNEMKKLCEQTPLPIALDEELIGIHTIDEKKELINTINPQYLILKPSLVGGFEASQEWISIANSQDIDYWITSALESNVGLNAIAQWTSTLDVKMPQGLGTGGLYTNNFDSPLQINNGKLIYDHELPWDIKPLLLK